MKITRRQLNRLIRENLGLEQDDTLNEIIQGLAFAPIAKFLGWTAAGTVPFYIDEIIAGFKNMLSYSPQKRAAVLLDPDHYDNPVNLMEPLSKARAERGAAKVYNGGKEIEMKKLAAALHAALDPVDTDEAGIQKALEMCKSKYEVAQVAHAYKDLYDENLKDEIYSDLTQDEFTNLVTLTIDGITPAITFRVGSDPKVYTYNDEEFVAAMERSYEAAGMEMPSGDKSKEEEYIAKNADRPGGGEHIDGDPEPEGEGQLKEASDLPKSAKSRLRGQMDRHLAAGSGRFQAHFRIEDDPNSKFVNISDVEADESSDHPKTSDLLGVLNSNMAKALLKDVPPGKYKIAVAI